MNFDKLLATSQDDLGHLFESLLKFSQCLLGIAIGTVLNGSSIMTCALNQQFALLLGLLAKLECIVMNTLSF